MLKVLSLSFVVSSMLFLSGCGNKNHESESLKSLMEDKSENAIDKMKQKEGEVRIKASTVSLEQKKKISTILDELSSIDGRMYYYEGLDIEVGGIKNLKIDSFDNFNNVLKSITNYEVVITKNKLFKDLPKVVELKEVKEASVLDDLQVGQSSLILPAKLLTSISNYANGWKIDYKNDLKTTINNSDIIDFNGSARDFIDFYAKSNNLFVDWDYKKKIITFSKYKQKILRLQIPNEKYKFTNNIDVDLNNSESGSISSGGGSSSGSSSGSSDGGKTGVELKSSYDIMENFKKMVTTIIPQNTADEYINVIEDTGHIAVSTNPTKMAQLEDVIKKLNGDAFKQVYVKVTMLETDLANQHQNGVNWNFVKNGLNSAGTGGEVMVGGINSQIASADVSLNAGDFFKYKNVTNGVGAMVKLLNVFGDTSVSFQNGGITTNNLPIIYNISNTQGFISEFKMEGVGDNITVAPTQDSVTGGTYLYLKPSMVEDRITLSVKMVSSRINPFIKQEFQDGQYVQSKDIDKKLFSQNIVMKSGEKIVIGGIIQKTVQNNYEGIAPTQNFIGSALFGVKDKAYKTKEIAIMLEVEEI